MGLSVRVDYLQISYAQTSCISSSMLTVGPGGCAAVGIISELMDVEATLGIGVVASDIPCNGGWGRLGRLLEGNGSRNLGVTSDGCNYNAQNTWLARI